MMAAWKLLMDAMLLARRRVLQPDTLDSALAEILGKPKRWKVEPGFVCDGAGKDAPSTTGPQRWVLHQADLAARN